MKLKFLLLLAFLALLLIPSKARAEDKPRATFALIVGSNTSVDKELTPLRYADDDAARYLDLFRLLGARTYLLTRLDENTKRIHPQAQAEALEPRKASFESSVDQLIADVTKASQRGVETLVYFVYAGHGNVQNGEGYITLEDMRLTGGDLAKLFQRVPATRIHVIADACASYFLAYSRGPGGERRPVENFSLGAGLTSDPRIGLLLSTSSARESHEWDAFQSGIFSHEVRSGLYGAADADGDGQVSYREIAAFVTRANAKVPNERFRPDIHARAPRGETTLLDIRRAGRKLEIDGKHAGHYYLEDARGVRIADLHNAEGQTLSIVRPAPSGRAWLRRVDDDMEFVIDPRPEVVSLASLTPESPRYASRGAAHESFTALFALGYDRNCVEQYTEVVEPGPEAPAAAKPERSWRKPIGWGLVGLGATSLVTGIAFSVAASDTYHQLDGNPNPDPFEVQSNNNSVASQENIAAAFYVTAGLATAAGVTLLLWPTKKAPAATVGAAPVRGGGFVGLRGEF